MDDVLNVSGHHARRRRVESALVLRQDRQRAAVVGFHDIRGQGIYAMSP